jgi:hypothetical protein
MHKTRTVILLLLAVAVFSFNSAEAQTAIVGQNNPSVDIQAVQKAVDQGGTVNLKGTFDFGNEGRVNITKDVKIVGETDSKGASATKIKGGFWTFHSPLPTKLPPDVSGPKITIQSIHFDGALWSPIQLAYCSGATISNNKITNLQPKPMDIPVFGKSGLNLQQAIMCHPGWAQASLETRKYIPNAFTGNLIIEDNNIDLTNDEPTKTMSQGMLVNWTTGITAHIQRNTITNCSRNSIEALDNYLGQDGSGMILIKDNKIVTSVEGLLVPSPAAPNGIIFGWFLDMSGGLDPQKNIKHLVANNAIRTRGKTSAGIGAFSDGAVIVNNIIQSEGTETIGLGVRSSDGYIAFNKIEGVSSRPGISVGPWKPLKGSKNVLMENDLSKFKSSMADIVFEKDGCNNLFIGPNSKVINLGTNNSIQMTK